MFSLAAAPIAKPVPTCFEESQASDVQLLTDPKQNSLVPIARRFRDFHVPLSGRLFRQTQERFHAALTVAIRKCQRATVRLRDLPAERETDA